MDIMKILFKHEEFDIKYILYTCMHKMYVLKKFFVVIHMYYYEM